MSITPVNPTTADAQTRLTIREDINSQLRTGRRDLVRVTCADRALIENILDEYRKVGWVVDIYNQHDYDSVDSTLLRFSK